MSNRQENNSQNSQDHRLRVLVVSADTGLRDQLLLAGLRRRGFVVDTMGTAADLYRQLFRQAYDLILIDSVLPDENGYSVAARLRCFKRVGVEMLSTLFELFGLGYEVGASRPKLDLDRVAAHLRSVADMLEEQPDPAASPWLRPDTTAQVMRSAS